MKHLLRKTMLSLVLFSTVCPIAAAQPELPAAPSIPEVAQPRPPEVPRPIQPPASAPTPGDEPVPPLDELINRALENNPEIASAMAEVQRAQAELQQVKMNTIRELTAHREALDNLRRLTDELRKRAEAGITPPSDASEAATRLAEAQAQLKYLVGDMPRLHDIRARLPLLPVHEMKEAKRPDTPALAEPLASMAITIDFDETPLRETLQFVSESTELGVVLDPAVAENPVSIHLANTPLGEVLLGIADAADVVFVVRDYGLFATTRERASRIVARTIPEDVPLHVE